jgi:serine/threonine protein phosphatase 1
MSKWRPSKNCIYVIPDIHGAVDLLEKFLVRILPLRNQGGKKDMLIFLGDYIDRHLDSPLVIQTLIDLKKEYPDQVICLKGNHEYMLLMGLEKYPNYLPVEYAAQWKMWLANGGNLTLAGYLNIAKQNGQVPPDLMSSSINSFAAKKFNLIPESHLDFMMNCLDFYETDRFCFIHGGGNPKIPWEKHAPEVIYWDRKLFEFVKYSIANNQSLPWQKTIISGHNGPIPLFHDKFMMLDAGSPRRLLILEANSREAFVAENDKSKLVKFSTANSIVKSGPFH